MNSYTWLWKITKVHRSGCGDVGDKLLIFAEDDDEDDDGEVRFLSRCHSPEVEELWNKTTGRMHKNFVVATLPDGTVVTIEHKTAEAYEPRKILCVVHEDMARARINNGDDTWEGEEE